MTEDQMIEKVKETIKKSSELIEGAKARLKETDELYQSLGIKRGKATEFLNKESHSPEVKERIKKDREQFQKEIEDEISQAIAQAKTEVSTGKKVDLSMKRGVMRI